MHILLFLSLSLFYKNIPKYKFHVRPFQEPFGQEEGGDELVHAVHKGWCHDEQLSYPQQDPWPIFI